MSSHIGNIGEYDEAKEDFKTYTKRVELFFKANKVDDSLKVASFLSIIGTKTFSLVNDLVAPEEPDSCSYKVLIGTLNNHYQPQVIVIFERYKFYKRCQAENESISDFAAAIKALARTCNFGNTLTEMLRDKFVLGLLDNSTQRTLLTKANLTYELAYETAICRELAAQDVKVLGAENNKSSTVNKYTATNYANSKATKKNNYSTRPKWEKTPTSNYNTKDKPKSACLGCGGWHYKPDCPFKDAECYTCKKKGHLQKVCYSKNKPNFRTKHNYVTTKTTNKCTEYRERDEYIFSQSDSSTTVPYEVRFKLNNTLVSMELDTGAARTIMSKSTYFSTFTNPPKLTKSSTKLWLYGKVNMKVEGQVTLTVKTSRGEINDLILLIVSGKGPTLLGRDWIAAMNIPIQKIVESINSVKTNTTNCKVQRKLNDMIARFGQIFEPGLGTFTGHTVKIDVQDEASPKYCKARPVPYAMKPKVDAELERLISEGIIEPISHSDWAAPIVPVLKPNKTIRICGDYRLTVNRVIKLDNYPLPKHEELLSSLAGGKYFAKLDLTQAYAQLVIDEESQKYTVINTHRGLFKYTRLSFGVASAPGIFQRTMEKLLRGKIGTVCFQDDVLISGKSPDELIDRLKEVLAMLQESGLRLNKEKCQWMLTEINYLGVRICAEGILPNEEKIRGILKITKPTNVTELKSYLGMLNFYRNFLSNAATMLEPLNRLLKADMQWVWKMEQQNAFELSKKTLLNSECLVHFDNTKQISVTCDSSSYGIGAVLNLIIDGKERPVSFASRTLTSAERKYSQTEKEALALIFGLKKFHFYLWGQNFRLVTDHKPLLGLFNNDKPISVMSSGRIQRWSLMLQGYTFTLVHKSGKTLGTADALSRLPIPSDIESTPVTAEWVNLVEFMDNTPVNATKIAKSTTKDKLLTKVHDYCMNGWPDKVDDELKPYSCRKAELSLQNGCILWGNRVIIPIDCRSKLIDELHSQHVGSTRMKQLARSYLWWPKLDSELEDVVKRCTYCLEHRNAPPHAELHPWEWPDKPWHRVHIDHAGPIKGHYFLIIVDAYSKYVEIFPTTSLTTATTIKLLRTCFARWGLPVVLVSDNAPCFSSEEFKYYITGQGIRHVTSSPHKPSTNGLAEITVKTFKNGVGNFEGEGIQERLDKFLFKHRLTPNSTTGLSPNELMIGRKVRSIFDLLQPNDSLRQKVLDKQAKQKENYDKSHPRKVDMKPNDTVIVRNYGKGSK